MVPGLLIPRGGLAEGLTGRSWKAYGASRVAKNFATIQFEAKYASTARATMPAIESAARSKLFPLKWKPRNRNMQRGHLYGRRKVAGSKKRSYRPRDRWRWISVFPQRGHRCDELRDLLECAWCVRCSLLPDTDDMGRRLSQTAPAIKRNLKMSETYQEFWFSSVGSRTFPHPPTNLNRKSKNSLGHC